MVVRFNRSFARIQPQKFIKDILVKKLGVKAIFVGEIFVLARTEAGTLLCSKSLLLNMVMKCTPLHSVKQGGEIISSTRDPRIDRDRKVKPGGKAFRQGCVCFRRGGQRGASAAGVWGIPRLISPMMSDILPPQGVYVVRIFIGTKEYAAIANIGTRPSFDKPISKLYLEVHILDFSKNIYGKRLKVVFLKKIRSEKKFSSPSKLIRQIQKDEAFARKYFAQSN